jgi:hypothetical protein
MNYTLVELFSYSVGIAALLGVVRYQKVDRAFFPFILLLWVGLLNEILATWFIRIFNTNAVNNNIYVLVESLLILWLFKNLSLFRKQKNLIYLIGSSFVILWVIDNFIISDIYRFSSYFRIVYSFVIVLMSIHMVNRLIVEARGWLLTNPVFLIMFGFIIFFTYKTLVEIFWVYGLNASRDFRLEVYRIMAYINLAVNITYAIAVLWIPRKRESLLQ